MSRQPTTRFLLACVTLSLTLTTSCVTVERPAASPHVVPGATVPQGGGSPVESPLADLGSPSPIFDTPAPVNLTLVLDTDNAVEVVIPVGGGTLSATGADGTVYSLDIPSDALLNDTTMTMTPVLSVAGMPFGGDQTHAVQLGPEGLFLQSSAILTITPVEVITVDEQIMFGYLQNGKDVVYAAPVAGAQEIKMHVSHFSGNGVTDGTQTPNDPLRERLGGDAERRLHSEIAAQLGLERQRQLICGECPDDPKPPDYDFAEALRQFEELVVKVRVAAAGESCEAAQLAIKTVLGVERQRQLLGASDGATDRYPGLVDKVARTCVLEEFEACVEHHRIFLMLPIYEGMLQQQSRFPMYSPGTLAEARDLTIKCLTFRLELESTGKLIWQGDARTESTVTMELMLRYNPELGLISGLGEFINTVYEVHFEDCTAAVTLGGGVFAVIGLLYELEYGAPDSDGNYPDARVNAITLAYSPGNSSEKAILTCPGDAGPPVIVPFDMPTWIIAYTDAHLNERGEGGMEAVDWEISGGELFAEKEWDLIGVADPTGSEAGSFELHHVPGG